MGPRGLVFVWSIVQFRTMLNDGGIFVFPSAWTGLAWRLGWTSADGRVFCRASNVSISFFTPFSLRIPSCVLRPAKGFPKMSAK